ncbi:hypothetical protein U27_01320 [Candidatus Vecturithrix granuli]|uniref:Uncharacterized protein n=1 Tax=Vecturithrix granuli TaxID=1499967 RepID=A0A081CA15_VECG1|nr:hypothetical protein U27_01320 [Candidatus Vecturithrix granuli]
MFRDLIANTNIVELRRRSAAIFNANGVSHFFTRLQISLRFCGSGDLQGRAIHSNFIRDRVAFRIKFKTDATQVRSFNIDLIGKAVRRIAGIRSNRRIHRNGESDRYHISRRSDERGCGIECPLQSSSIAIRWLREHNPGRLNRTAYNIPP